MCPDFGEITQITVIMTSFKVTNFGTNEKPACDFLCDYLHSDSCIFSEIWWITWPYFRPLHGFLSMGVGWDLVGMGGVLMGMGKFGLKTRNNPISYRYGAKHISIS